MTMLLVQVRNREEDITMNSAFVHVESDQEDLKVKASIYWSAGQMGLESKTGDLDWDVNSS